MLEKLHLFCSTYRGKPLIWLQYLGVLCLVFLSFLVKGQSVSLTTLGTAYTQDFDALPASGSGTWTNSSTISGWYHARTGNGTTVVADGGTNNAGNLYSYGTGTTTERALGSVGSGNAAAGNFFWGVRLQNNTGSTITSLDVSYTGEQWRNSAAAAQTISFSYLVGSPTVAGSLAEFQMPGVAVTSLDFTSPITGGAAGALNGNLAANKTTVTFTINGLNIPNGTEVMLRWSDPDHTGSDHGLSIDNFSVTPQGSSVTSLSINDVSLNEGNTGTTTFSFTVSLSAPAGAGGVTFDIATADNTATQPSDYTAKLLTGQTIPAGSSTYTFDVLVNGDVTPEANETFFVNVTNVTGVTVSDGQGQGTIVNDDGMTITPIHDIQSNGSTSPLVGQTVSIRGIVVGDFENSPTITNLSGFYVQEEDAEVDADPATSEGIFVFEGVNTNDDVQVGDLVTVTGTVAEFVSSGSSLTQLTSPTIVKNSTGNPIPTIATVQLPVTNVSDLERYEGMLVNVSAVSGNLIVTEDFQLGRFGQVVLSTTGASNQPGTDARLDQYTQFNAPNVNGYMNYLAEIAKRRIYLDDGRSVSNPDPVIFGRGGNPLSASNTLRGGDEVAVVAGILDERFEGYRIQTLTSPNFMATNARSNTPPSVGGTLKVASFNVLNYFNGNGMGGGFPTSRGATTAAEFTRQRDKIIQAIIGTGADVLGLMELEDDGYGPNSAIQDLVNGLNAIAGTGTYNFVDPGDISDDEITVAMIYKPATIELVGVAAAIPFTYGTGSFDVVNRRSLAQTLKQKSSNEIFTLVVNHFKSKGSSSGGAGDADAGDGQGESNGTRTRQAQDLVSWLATNPTATMDPDYLLIGDFNAYAQEDPLTTFAMAGYTNLNPNTSYSYVFDGQVGSLDHALGSSSLVAKITGAEKWHINADEPLVLDYNVENKSVGQQTSFYNNDAFRSSDHDPVLVGMFPTADLSITKTDGVTTATPGGSVTYTITASNAGPSNVAGATIADTFPAILTGTWTCVGAGGGTCTASGSGNINDLVNLPSGGSVTYTVSATISPSATGTLSNTATVTAPMGVTDPNPGNNSATDTDTMTPTADLSITKTDGVTTATPGGSVTYTITASNAGPSNVAGATIADTFPAILTGTWTCVGAGGGTCTASGSGNINDLVNLPAGGSVTYTVSATISPSATGTLSNTATVTAPMGVTDPNPGNNSATDTDTMTPTADLSITKTDGVTTATPGGSVTYTITASNAGPSNAIGVNVSDTFPAILTGTWTCVGAGGGTCTASGSGNINDLVNLPSGGSVTYTVSATISPSATGTLSNTATVTAPMGVTDPNPGNNSATDTDVISCPPIPVSIIGSGLLCTGQSLTLSPNTGGTWSSNSPTIATVTNEGVVTGISAGMVSFTFTQTGTSCTATTNNVTVKSTPASMLTASKQDVCPNTEVTLDAHCSESGATVNWNPGGATVIPNAPDVAYIYKASCTLDGCTGNESSVEVRTHRILVDLKDVGMGVQPKVFSGSVKDNLAATNVISAPVSPRLWTLLATGCSASESAVFKLTGPVNFSSIDNNPPYALFANVGSTYFAIDHPNYGNGGSGFPNGTYNLVVDLRTSDGVGGPFPKNRVAVGSLLATRSLQFTVSNPLRSGIENLSVGELVLEEENWFSIFQNPVSNEVVVRLSGSVGDEIALGMVNLQGQMIHQRNVKLTSPQQYEVLNVRAHSAGMYILKAIKGDKVKTLKVVKVE